MQAGLTVAKLLFRIHVAKGGERVVCASPARLRGSGDASLVYVQNRSCMV